jgi:hypothetical protein
MGGKVLNQFLSSKLFKPTLFPSLKYFLKKKRRFNKYFGMFIFRHSLPASIMKKKIARRVQVRLEMNLIDFEIKFLDNLMRLNIQ